MQDAVAAQDRQSLEEADAIRLRLLGRMAEVPGAVTEAQAAQIRERVDAYYRAAQDSRAG